MRGTIDTETGTQRGMKKLRRTNKYDTGTDTDTDTVTVWGNLIDR